MSRTSLTKGRVNQKQRTRSDILRAAQRVLARRAVLSADEIAAEAAVSRATLYRYFPNLDLLMIEAPLDEKAGEPEDVIAKLLDDERLSAAERVVRVQRYFFDLAAGNEPRFRMFLKASMEQWLQSGGKKVEKRRGARRVAMLEKALEPVRARIERGDRERLVHALSALLGIESLVVMSDVCGLDREQGRAVCEWAVRVLTEAVLREAPRAAKSLPSR